MKKINGGVMKKRYFKFTNARTGASTYYGNGLTISQHMKLMRKLDEFEGFKLQVL